MSNSTVTTKAWAFLHSRNRQADYSFALLPEFLVRDKAAQNSLASKLSAEPGEHGSAELNLGHQRYVIHFSADHAYVDGKLARDCAGRLIVFTKGVISEDTLDDEAYSSLLSEAAPEIESAWMQFWRDGRRPIIESKPRSRSAHSSRYVEPQLDPRPAPASAPPPRAKPRPAASLLLVIGILSVACAMELWMVLALRKDVAQLEDTIKKLEFQGHRAPSTERNRPDAVKR
jgi:hypothetical protein